MTKLIIETGGYSIRAAIQEGSDVQKIALGINNAPYSCFSLCGKLADGQFVFGKDVQMTNCESFETWQEVEQQPYYKQAAASLLDFVIGHVNRSIDAVCFVIPAHWHDNEPKKKVIQQIATDKGWGVDFVKTPQAVCLKKANLTEGEYALFFDAGYNGCTVSLIQRQRSSVILVDSILSESFCGSNIDSAILQKMNDVLMAEIEDAYMAFLYSEKMEDEVEYIKHKMMFGQQCIVPVNGGTRMFPITKTDYHNLIAKPLADSFQVCSRIITENHIDPAAIKQILLYGGTSRIPFVKEQLSAYVHAQFNNEINVISLACDAGVDFTAIEGASLLTGAKTISLNK